MVSPSTASISAVSSVSPLATTRRSNNTTPTIRTSSKSSSSKSSSHLFSFSSGSVRGKRIKLLRTTTTTTKERQVVTKTSSQQKFISPLFELAAKKTPATVVVAAKPVAMCAAVAASLSAASPLAFPVFTAAAILPVTLAYINPVYSFSVGYGLSVAASAGILLKSASISGILLPELCQLHILGGLLYGLRLGIFLAIRSKTWKDWGKKAKASPEAQNSKSFLQKTMVIVGCGFIYALMASPMLFHYQHANVVAHHEIL